MADPTNAEVSDERLREIIAGCEGVTPGPWKAIDKLHGRVAVISDDTGLVYGLTNDAPFPAVVAHIARLDPDTVKALATELLNRRSVTSQASEGAALDANGYPTGSIASAADDDQFAARLADGSATFAPVSKRVERLETALKESRQWLQIVADEYEKASGEPQHIADTIARIVQALQGGRS